MKKLLRGVARWNAILMVLLLLPVAYVLGFIALSRTTVEGKTGAGASSVVDWPERSCQLSLALPEKMSYERSEGTRLEIKNVGRAPVTLVMPGDGSGIGWRTPLIWWSILPVDSDSVHSDSPPPPPKVVECGNTNPLRPEEVFTLQPGETKRLNDWSQFPIHDFKPGKHRAKFYYRNVPDLKWSGLPLFDGHDEKAMALVKSSTPISLASNEAQVEITD